MSEQILLRPASVSINPNQTVSDPTNVTNININTQAIPTVSNASTNFLSTLSAPVTLAIALSASAIVVTVMIVAVYFGSTVQPVVTITTTPIPCVNMQWNTVGVTVAGTGVFGTSANQLNQPWNLFVDSNYSLYIADAANHRIHYWPAGASSGTTIAGVSGSWGSTSTQLDMPSDVFVDANKNIYVADRNNNRIQFFSSGSTSGTAGITVSTGWGGVGNFRGVQVTSTGLIYGSDTSNNALWRNNTVPLGYQGAGGASNQLNGNQGITLDTSTNPGYVYIANANQHTVVQWIPVSSNATVVAGTNGVSGSTSATMNVPVAVRIDQYGNLYVVDNNNHRIQVYCRYPTISSTGRTVAGITGSPGSSATQLNFPSGIALDKDLNIYVADNSNHRIQKFTRIA